MKMNMSSQITGPIKGANVIGEITGRADPDRYLVLGAHLDSWDEGTGAIDDGAGVELHAEFEQLLHVPSHAKRYVRQDYSGGHALPDRSLRNRVLPGCRNGCEFQEVSVLPACRYRAKADMN